MNSKVYDLPTKSEEISTMDDLLQEYTTDLVDENLLFSCWSKRVDIGDNDGNDQVNHDERAEDYESNEEDHGEEQRQRVFFIGAVVESIKLKLSEYHDDDLQQRLARIAKVFIVTAEADDKECKTKSNDHDDEGDGALDNSLGDGVEHDAESSSQEWISSDHENYFNPGKTNSSRGYNIENLEVLHEEHGGESQGEDEKLEPALHLMEVSPSQCSELPELLEEENTEGDDEEDLDTAEWRIRVAAGSVTTCEEFERLFLSFNNSGFFLPALHDLIKRVACWKCSCIGEISWNVLNYLQINYQDHQEPCWHILETLARGAETLEDSLKYIISRNVENKIRKRM